MALFLVHIPVQRARKITTSNLCQKFSFFLEEGRKHFNVSGVFGLWFFFQVFRLPLKLRVRVKRAVGFNSLTVFLSQFLFDGTALLKGCQFLDFFTT